MEVDGGNVFWRVLHSIPFSPHHVLLLLPQWQCRTIRTQFQLIWTPETAIVVVLLGHHSVQSITHNDRYCMQKKRSSTLCIFVLIGAPTNWFYINFNWSCVLKHSWSRYWCCFGVNGAFLYPIQSSQKHSAEMHTRVGAAVALVSWQTDAWLTVRLVVVEKRSTGWGKYLHT